MLNDFITNHNRKIELYLVRADFKKKFDKDLDAHITTDYTIIIISRISPRQQLLDLINSFIPKGYKFSQITETNN